ncbi:methyltransferase domain-containing protein [Candidatus Bathyarchaeota archaeon]|nr:MAG: methyltransferase domain-containing protein [Candidatus Bathyarchaeota archaeon]
MGRLGPGSGKESAVLPVTRSKSEARRFYDGISQIYDLLSRAFERRHVERALELLSPEEGESVLEVGFGTGHGLKDMAERVGIAGGIVGLDISSGMVRAATRRLEAVDLMDRISLCCGDAGVLPFRDGVFDAAFMGFTLELFDNPEIPLVLDEIRRVLSPGGRFGIVGLSKETGPSRVLRIYEWAHERWPVFFDCRPIHVEESLRSAGYGTIAAERSRMAGLPVGIIVAEKIPLG